MADTRIHAAGTGAILFDAGLGVQPDDIWFDPDHWHAQGKLAGRARGGRGSVVFIDTPAGQCALRHYHRGGMVAPILGDRYMWNGRERTRGFAEFRLLAELRARELPVPEPVAARYLRSGVHYTADLITRRIPHADYWRAIQPSLASPRLRVEEVGRSSMLSRLASLPTPG